MVVSKSSAKVLLVLFFSSFVSTYTICSEAAYHPHENRCFRFSSKRLQYIIARQQCLDEGGDIASVFTDEHDLYRTLKWSHQELWYPVDPQSRFNSSFYLVNGEMSVAEWENVDTDFTSNLHEECLTIIPLSGRIMKTSCWLKYSYLCEVHPGKQKLLRKL